MKISEKSKNDYVTDGESILRLYDANTVNRKEVEAFISQVFDRAYDASLQQFMPQLMALQDESECTVAALGMRNASTESLYLEQYLDLPVEQALMQIQGNQVARDKIIEVGNLASVHRGGLRKLIIALTSYLTGAGAEWVVFTAVPTVQKAFSAMGLNLHKLAYADKSLLSQAEQKSWGRYYETKPMVVAGHIEEGYRRIRQMLNDEKAMQLNWCLWQYAFDAGSRQRIVNLSAVVNQQVA